MHTIHLYAEAVNKMGVKSLPVVYPCEDWDPPDGVRQWVKIMLSFFFKYKRRPRQLNGPVNRPGQVNGPIQVEGL